MSLDKSPTQVPMDRWEDFLRALGDRVSTASERNPSARCWKRSALQSEIRAVTNANVATLLTTFPSGLNVIDQLKRMGLIHPIKVQSPDEAERIEFLVLDMEAGKGEPVYPLELLQAYLPSGVVCYFSAIAYHELTTQVATHHHIARLTPPTARKSWDDMDAMEVEKAGKRVKRNPLGTEIFRFEDAVYYLNKRDASLVPGIQVRVVSPRCWLRITTLEQSLLDALVRPARCGGEAVVLEAWETGVKQMDAERMADHLAKMQREDLERRVGAILSLISVDFTGTALGHRLNALRERMMAQDAPGIPLLAGFEFPAWNKTWKVRTP